MLSKAQVAAYIGETRHDESMDLFLGLVEVFDLYQSEYLSDLEMLLYHNDSRSDEEAVDQLMLWCWQHCHDICQQQGVTLRSDTPRRILLDVTAALRQITDHEDVEGTHAICESAGPASERIARLVARHTTANDEVVFSYIEAVDYAVIDRISTVIRPMLTDTSSVDRRSVAQLKKYMLFCQWLGWTGVQQPDGHIYTYSLEAVGLPLEFYVRHYAQAHPLPTQLAQHPEVIAPTLRDLASLVMLSSEELFGPALKKLTEQLFDHVSDSMKINASVAALIASISKLSVEHQAELAQINQGLL